MKRHDVLQGTSEWAALRLGIPTASQFDRLVTPKTGKPSAQMLPYAYELLFEQALRVPFDSATSGFMERGTVLEKKAVSFYELQNDCTVDRVGFITNDAGTVGCSPDGLVGDRGGVEIKTPAGPTHISYLLGDAGEKYRCQVQGCLWIAEREYWDFVSYNPDLPSTIVRFERDDDFIKLLAKAIDQLNETMAEAKADLQKRYGMFPDFKLPEIKVA